MVSKPPYQAWTFEDCAKYMLESTSGMCHDSQF
jgi:hypothetical protein